MGDLYTHPHTRPYIAYAVSVITQLMHNPKEMHLRAIYRVLLYLKMSHEKKKIIFRKSDRFLLKANTDVDHSGSVVDIRSTIGYYTFIGGNLVT